MKSTYLIPSALLFLLIGLILSCNRFGSSDQLVDVGNELFTRSFYGSSNDAGPILTNIFDKKSSTQINQSSSSYFEFVINNQLTSNLDPLWKYMGHETRKMGNSGTEHVLSFRGIEDHVDGLQLKIIQQVFPGWTIIREKLVLSADGDKTFTLNKLENKLHFEFPKYSLPVSEDEALKSTEIRIASWELKPITFESNNPNRNQNHMYYPDIITREINGEHNVKGPMNVLATDDYSWITVYEHASQDNLKGLLNESKVSEDGKIVDAMQGTKGIFNFPVADEDFRFLEIRQNKMKNAVSIATAIMRGGYLDGEVVSEDKAYSTVWSATAFHEGNDLETSKAIIRNYLFNGICEKPASRTPEFYYNTWGMQRADKSNPLRGILTYERIYEEIDRAAQLGVDIFVLDDGWEQAQGDWTPHEERLPQGLAPIKKKLDDHGIKMGIWLSPMGIDSTTERYKKHPEWIIKDSEGNPILAQWGHPAFDFVGGFSDVFIDDCKRLIDDGVLFFKWDAINTFYSSLPNLDHGSDQYPESERRARYEYLLPIYVTRAMEILTDYEPDLIIEMDVTEARRVMIGLAPLSQGKLFHMNNGASWYNDYTEFRTNSMRTIPNEYNGIIPLELFTFANYPHNLENSMHYNVNTSLIAGHGFWGDLSLTSEEDRKTIGRKVAKSKLVLPYLTEIETNILGKVGDSLEVYSQINEEACAGQIIAFGTKKGKLVQGLKIDSTRMLAVLDHPYRMMNGFLTLDIFFEKNPSTTEAFIIPNEDNGVSITSSTSEIENAVWESNQLNYTVTDPGSQTILWNKRLGKPVIKKAAEVSYTSFELGDFYRLKIDTKKENQTIIIKRGI